MLLIEYKISPNEEWITLWYLYLYVQNVRISLALRHPSPSLVILNDPWRGLKRLHGEQILWWLLLWKLVAESLMKYQGYFFKKISEWSNRILSFGFKKFLQVLICGFSQKFKSTSRSIPKHKLRILWLIFKLNTSMLLTNTWYQKMYQLMTSTGIWY